MKAQEIARSIGVGARTKKYVLRDRNGDRILDAMDAPSWDAVLCAVSRVDISDLPGHVHTVAFALRKCITTGRMNPISALRIASYTPYQICALVARIVRECPETTVGGICDDWITPHHDSL